MTLLRVSKLYMHIFMVQDTSKHNNMRLYCSPCAPETFIKHNVDIYMNSQTMTSARNLHVIIFNLVVDL
jgi:hypothetical protein